MSQAALSIARHLKVPTGFRARKCMFDGGCHTRLGAQYPAAEREIVLPDHDPSHLQKERSRNIMRPKKIILCVDDNEQELSVLSFILSTNGYKVLPANTGQEAIDIFATSQIDLVLTDFSMPQMNGAQLVKRLKQMGSHVPMILLGEPQSMGSEIHAADAMLAKRNCSSLELLERVKIMSARKRGPRKGTHRMTHAVEELAAVS
jgi:two-component system response regulator CpxR